LNICMVTLDSPLNGIRDGITSHVYHLSNNLERNGHKVWVIGLDLTASSIQWVNQGNLTNIGIPSKTRSLLFNMFKLVIEGRKIIKKIDSRTGLDILHGHGGYAAPICLIDIGIPKILTLHNTYEFDDLLLNDFLKKRDYLGWIRRYFLYPKPLLNLYRRWYFHNVSHIISVSRHNVEVTSKKYDLPVEKFTVIPNGFDACEIPELKIETDPNLLLYFGRLEPHKGLNLLLDAFSRLLSLYPEKVLGIAGDGGYLEQLKGKASKLEITENVVFYGRLDRDELFKRIKAARIILFPSYYEGIPVSLFEAAAMGKPILASRIPGHTELFTDGEHCIFFDSGDVEDLTGKMILLLENLDLSEKLGGSAQQMTYNNYQWNMITDITLKVYNKKSKEVN